MRSIWTIFLTGLLAACAVRPFQLVQVVPTAAPDTVYRCALGQANILGYAISQGDKDAGFFKAEKAFTPGIASWDWGNAIRHELAVLVAEQSGGAVRVNVTASRYNNGQLEKISRDLKADAETVLGVCSR